MFPQQNITQIIDKKSNKGELQNNQSTINLGDSQSSNKNETKDVNNSNKNKCQDPSNEINSNLKQYSINNNKLDDEDNINNNNNENNNKKLCDDLNNLPKSDDNKTQLCQNKLDNDNKKVELNENNENKSNNDNQCVNIKQIKEKNCDNNISNNISNENVCKDLDNNKQIVDKVQQQDSSVINTENLEPYDNNNQNLSNENSHKMEIENEGENKNIKSEDNRFNNESFINKSYTQPMDIDNNGTANEENSNTSNKIISNECISSNINEKKDQSNNSINDNSSKNEINLTKIISDNLIINENIVSDNKKQIIINNDKQYPNEEYNESNQSKIKEKSINTENENNQIQKNKDNNEIKSSKFNEIPINVDNNIISVVVNKDNKETISTKKKEKSFNSDIKNISVTVYKDNNESNPSEIKEKHINIEIENNAVTEYKDNNEIKSSENNENTINVNIEKKSVKENKDNKQTISSKNKENTIHSVNDNIQVTENKDYNENKSNEIKEHSINVNIENKSVKENLINPESKNVDNINIPVPEVHKIDNSNNCQISQIKSDNNKMEIEQDKVQFPQNSSNLLVDKENNKMNMEVKEEINKPPIETPLGPNNVNEEEEKNFNEYIKNYRNLGNINIINQNITPQGNVFNLSNNNENKEIQLNNIHKDILISNEIPLNEEYEIPDNNNNNKLSPNKINSLRSSINNTKNNDGNYVLTPEQLNEIFNCIQQVNNSNIQNNKNINECNDEIKIFSQNTKLINKKSKKINNINNDNTNYMNILKSIFDEENNITRDVRIRFTEKNKPQIDLKEENDISYNKSRDNSIDSHSSNKRGRKRKICDEIKYIDYIDHIADNDYLWQTYIKDIYGYNNNIDLDNVIKNCELKEYKSAKEYYECICDKYKLNRDWKDLQENEKNFIEKQYYRQKNRFTLCELLINKYMFFSINKDKISADITGKDLYINDEIIKILQKSLDNNYDIIQIGNNYDKLSEKEKSIYEEIALRINYKLKSINKLTKSVNCGKYVSETIKDKNSRLQEQTGKKRKLGKTMIEWKSESDDVKEKFTKESIDLNKTNERLLAIRKLYKSNNDNIKNEVRDPRYFFNCELENRYRVRTEGLRDIQWDKFPNSKKNIFSNIAHRYNLTNSYISYIVRYTYKKAEEYKKKNPKFEFNKETHVISLIKPKKMVNKINHLYAININKEKKKKNDEIQVKKENKISFEDFKGIDIKTIRENTIKTYQQINKDDPYDLNNIEYKDAKKIHDDNVSFYNENGFYVIPKSDIVIYRKPKKKTYSLGKKRNRQLEIEESDNNEEEEELDENNDNDEEDIKKDDNGNDLDVNKKTNLKLDNIENENVKESVDKTDIKVNDNKKENNIKNDDSA